MSTLSKLSASMEDYLEAIHNIIDKQGAVRVKDISGYLDVKAASVTAALQALAKAELVNYKPYGIITLTPKGNAQAQKVIHKHRTLKAFFVDILDADRKEAETVACKIEHVITDKLFSRLICFTNFIKSCPECGSNLIEAFHRYCQANKKCHEQGVVDH